MESAVNLHTIPALQEIYVQEGIKLHPLHSSDAKRLLEILADDSSIRNKVTIASRLHTIEDIETEIKRSLKKTGLIRYVLLKENNPIGLVSLWRDEGYFGTPTQLDDYGFGYFLDPNERGKGLMTSAIRKLIEIVANNLKVNQFIAFCEDNNMKSIAVLTKLGFEPTDKTFSEPYNGWIERKYIKSILP